AGTLVFGGSNTSATGLTVANSGGTLQFNNTSAFIDIGRSVVVGNGGAVTFASPTAAPGSTGFGPISNAFNRIHSNSTGTLALQMDGSVQNPITEDLDFSPAGSGGALNLSLGGAALQNVGGASNTMVRYTGIITPNANTFRLGGGGGRLMLTNGASLSGNNSLNIGGAGNTQGQLFLQ